MTLALQARPFHNDFGESALRLTPSSALRSANYFTPFNQIAMNSNPSDLGRAACCCCRRGGSTQHPNLAILGSQTGTLYLLDRANLGGYTPGGPDKVVQELTLPGAIYGTPAFWQGVGDQHDLHGGKRRRAEGFFRDERYACRLHQVRSRHEMFALPGASPAISSNGMNGGIVWMLDTGGIRR